MPANQYISDNELFHFIGRGLKSDEDRFMLLSDTILDKESLRHPPFSDEGGAPKRIVSRTMDGRWLGSL